MTTLYLCGPMKGIRHLNRKTFMQAQKHYEALGHRVENPHEIGGALDIISQSEGIPNPTEKEYLVCDLSYLAECDAMVVLPGYQDSKGCNVEVLFALSYGIPVYEAYSDRRLGFNLEMKFNPTLTEGQFLTHALSNVTLSEDEVEEEVPKKEQNEKRTA